MKRRFPGYLITFEGLDGTGKTVQSKRLVEYLNSIGKPTIHTFEPGGTEMGKTLREIVLNKRKYKCNISKAAILFLFQADRAQHYKEVLKPALAAGTNVVSARYFDSTLVYQGHGSGWSIPFLYRLHNAATSMLLPDLTFVFHGVHHKQHDSNDRWESKPQEFKQKVEQALLNFKDDRYKHIVIPDKPDWDDVFNNVCNHVHNLFQ